MPLLSHPGACRCSACSRTGCVNLLMGCHPLGRARSWYSNTSNCRLLLSGEVERITCQCSCCTPCCAGVVRAGSSCLRHWRFSGCGLSLGLDSELLRRLERLSARVIDPQVARQLSSWPVPGSFCAISSFSSQLGPLVQSLGRRHLSLGMVSM